ncbi:hypothetical protein B9Q27_11125, partial [Enterobacter kobei]
EIQELLDLKSIETKQSLLKELKKEKAEIDQSLKTHRAKINQRIQKTLKEKIAILNIDLLTIILILLSTTTVLQILTIIYLIWRK